MPSVNEIIEHLHSHKFKQHPNGNYSMCGLEEIGCHSIIEYDNDIWMFYAFQTNTNNAIYYNKDRKPFVIDSVSTKKLSDMNVKRMIENE